MAMRVRRKMESMVILEIITLLPKRRSIVLHTLSVLRLPNGALHTEMAEQIMPTLPALQLPLPTFLMIFKSIIILKSSMTYIMPGMSPSHGTMLLPVLPFLLRYLAGFANPIRCGAKLADAIRKYSRRLPRTWKPTSLSLKSVMQHEHWTMAKL